MDAVRPLFRSTVVGRERLHASHDNIFSAVGRSRHSGLVTKVSQLMAIRERASAWSGGGGSHSHGACVRLMVERWKKGHRIHSLSCPPHIFAHPAATSPLRHLPSPPPSQTALPFLTPPPLLEPPITPPALAFIQPKQQTVYPQFEPNPEVRPFPDPSPSIPSPEISPTGPVPEILPGFAPSETPFSPPEIPTPSPIIPDIPRTPIEIPQRETPLEVPVPSPEIPEPREPQPEVTPPETPDLPPEVSPKASSPATPMPLPNLVPRLAPGSPLPMPPPQAVPIPPPGAPDPTPPPQTPPIPRPDPPQQLPPIPGGPDFPVPPPDFPGRIPPPSLPEIPSNPPPFPGSSPGLPPLTLGSMARTPVTPVSLMEI